MRIALTGATGLVGRFLQTAITRAGHSCVPLTGWRLGQPAELAGCDALIHAAFAHVPGRYRGGEGDDPQGFWATNVEGSTDLFEDARAQGVQHVQFLSSRAVYDGHPPGAPLPDGTPVRPASLYGKAKVAVEERLAQMNAPDFRASWLRATGVYGPGPGHKWCGLFADFQAGRPIAPRLATEVHGDDLGDAAIRVIDAEASGAFNVSDLILDRRDLLAAVGDVTGQASPLPSAADASGLSVMTCERLQKLGWRPGGMALLRKTLPHMVLSDCN